MAAKTSTLLVLVLSALVTAQRGSYNRRPVGYPIITTSTTVAPLGDKLGEDGSTVSTTTVRLPAEVLGDRELYDRLSKLPVEKQPFWLLNWQALEANRNNPQSYQPNSNSFVERVVEQDTQNRFGGNTNQNAQNVVAGQNLETGFSSSQNSFSQNAQRAQVNRFNAQRNVRGPFSVSNGANRLIVE